MSVTVNKRPKCVVFHNRNYLSLNPKSEINYFIFALVGLLALKKNNHICICSRMCPMAIKDLQVHASFQSFHKIADLRSDEGNLEKKNQNGGSKMVAISMLQTSQ